MARRRLVEGTALSAAWGMVAVVMIVTMLIVMGPIGASLAQTLGGHQCNTLVMGPDGMCPSAVSLAYAASLA